MVLEGYNIRIYDIERCVCDAIKFRNKIGIDVCSEIIDNYLTRPERNISKLLDYARQLRVGTILENYLQVKLWVKNKIKTTEKSIRTKLLNVAKKENIFYQTILTRYFQERLLYRMSQTRYRNNFYLKGGALMYAYERFAARPTLDIDFLGNNISTVSYTHLTLPTNSRV